MPIIINRERLPMNIRWDAPHHVMTGRHYRNRFFHWIDVCKCSTQFANPRQP